jgi:Uma2 family endonuclease
MIGRVERLFTPEEYLMIERNADFKSEYVCGKIYAMAGASIRHNRIAANVTGELYGQLKGKPCQAYSSDLRLKVGDTGLYTYPDVSVVCGEPNLLDDTRDVLLNPTVIVEVLSPSTATYGRGEKAEYYRDLESLTDYVLIAQDKPWIEHYARQEGSGWFLTETTALDGEVALASIGCTLRLADVYDRVSFPGERAAR